MQIALELRGGREFKSRRVRHKIMGDIIMKRLWKVNLGKYGEYESIARDSSVVTIDFHINRDIKDYDSREKLIELMREIFPDAKDKRRSNFAAQINQFINKIEIGDLVVCPFSTTKTISIGEVVSNYICDPTTKKPTRKVKWLKQELSRDTFKQDLLYSIGAFMTVCEIKRNSALERVENVAKGNLDTGDGVQPDLSDTSIEESSEENFDLELIARDQIERKIASGFSGHDFTRLVNAILEAQGYSTFVSPPGPDKGVDILAGSGELGLENPKIVVQVKSGSVAIDQQTIQALLGSVHDQKADYGLVVCWGGMTSAVRARERELYFKVRFWDRATLVDNLLEVYDALPESIKVELPLKKVWMAVDEDQVA